MTRIAKIQIAVGGIAALLLVVLRSGMVARNDGAWPDVLEALSFLLCCAAIASSAKRLRERYQQLGMDKRLARQSPEYVQMRQSVRWWSYVGALVIAALAAPRFDLPIVTFVGALAVILPVLMIVTDRASGWTTEA